MYISEVPPMAVSDRPELGAKSAIFNTLFRKHTTAKGVQVQPVTEYKEYAYRDILSKKDGFHLNKTGQEVLARQFEATAAKDETTSPQTKTPKPQKVNPKTPVTRKTPEIRKTPETRKSPTNPTIDTCNITTRSELIKFVVGKKGATVKRLEEDHNARIRITNNTIQIKAPHEDAQRAERAIKKILEDKEKDEKSQVCQYYARGSCTFGPKCRNLHSKKRGRSPNTSPGAGNKRPYTSPGGGNRRKSGSPPRKRLSPRELGSQNSFSVLE